jgi:hypothetical protein
LWHKNGGYQHGAASAPTFRPTVKAAGREPVKRGGSVVRCTDAHPSTPEQRSHEQDFEGEHGLEIVSLLSQS